MEMNELIKQKASRINAVIEQYLPEESGPQKTIFEAMNYSMRVGGKRLRPMLMQETYWLFGGGGKEIEPFMAAIEMIHTSSLIHDDLPCMDNDVLRRGAATTWVKFGYDMGVLAGDALLIYAIETAAKALTLADSKGQNAARVAGAMGLLAKKTGIYGMVGGQVVDVELTGKPIPKDKLDFIYRLKTGALLEASMMVGGMLAGASDEELSRVEELAGYLGLAFQIQDDILDVSSSEEQLGKPIFSDEKNEKTTYVTVEGIEKARRDVEKFSSKAVELLHTLPGENTFLEALIWKMAKRKR